MAGTKAGGLKAAATNREKYGKEFYSQIGRKGGQNGSHWRVCSKSSTCKDCRGLRAVVFHVVVQRKSCVKLLIT